MHIPSGLIWERMKTEEVGAWLDGSTEPPGFVMIAKLPMTVVRSLQLGTPIRLRSWVVDVDGKHVAAFGLEVDDPQDRLLAYGPCRSPEEVHRLRALLATTSTFHVQIHNDVFLPLLELQCRFGGLRSTVEKMDTVQAHDTETRREAMDAINASLQSGATTHPSILHDGAEAIAVDDRQPLSAYVAGAGEFRLADSDQGNELERLVLTAFDYMCPFGAYHQPLVELHGSRRELCDVLALSRVPEHPIEGIFVVESKALAMTEETINRTGERRGSAVQKHILQAIGQLSGAIRRLKRGDNVLRKDGTPLQQDPPEVAGIAEPIDIAARARNLGHAIVMVSDMHPSVDWEAVATALVKAREATGYLFHVLDLRELQRIVSYSQERPFVMEANLVLRWEAMVKEKSAMLRALPASTSP